MQSNSIGYFDSKSNAHYHYIKDHIGNISAVVNSTADTLVQSTIYYASGVPMNETKGIPYNLYNACGVQPNQNFGRDEQPYLYNGKEFIDDIISVNIYSMTGQLLRACDGAKPNLQGLPAGTYMVVYNSNNNSITPKLVLQ